MANPNPAEEQAQQVSYLLSSFNTRLRELEERNKMIRERVMLLSQNFIFLKEESSGKLEEMKKQLNKLQTDMDKIKSTVQSLISETDKYTRKSEVLVIERMLKDFQPLEFMRRKDVEELIEKKLAKLKNQDKEEKESPYQRDKNINSNNIY